MRTFVTIFAMQVLGTGLIYILTDTLHVPRSYRLPVVLALTGAALLATWLVEEKRDVSERERRRSRVFSSLAFAVSVSGILLLTCFSQRPKEATVPSTEVVAKDKAQIAQNQGATTTSPIGPVRVAHEPAKKDTLLDAIDQTPRFSASGTAWVVQMYSGDGGDFPILRAAALEALAAKGNAVTSLVKTSVPVRTNVELFTANPATLNGLKPFCEGLMIGKVEVHAAPSDQFPGMYATHMVADVRLISTTKGVLREFVIEEDGPGFDAGVSRSNAERRLAEKLKKELANSTFR